MQNTILLPFKEKQIAEPLMITCLICNQIQSKISVSQFLIVKILFFTPTHI